MSARRIYVITIHPRFVTAYSEFGAFRSARENGLVEVVPVDLRDYAVDKHGSIDDHPYGGGEGMVMRPEPLAAAIDALPEKPFVVMTTPGGKLWTQREAEQYASQILRSAQEVRPLAFICGRFAGVDQRFVDAYVDAEYSCGDVVLTGGELPALLMIDSIIRLIPGVLGHADSANLDSFGTAFDGGLEHPLYTRPPEFRGQKVPEVLLSGDHERIAHWRQTEARARTRRLRPDLLLRNR